MRKMMLMLLTMLLLCCSAALADVITVDDFCAEFEIDGSKYTIMTRENLSGFTDELAKKGTTPDVVLRTWQEQGIYVQAWNKDGDVCIQVDAVQDDYAANYFDVNNVTSEDRKAYRIGHSSDATGYWRAKGYDYSSADWQNYKNIGRFLKAQFTRTVDGETYRGHARKTIRNGWHINVEYQVYGRSLKTADKNAIENLMKTWAFVEVLPRPATATTGVTFTSVPPQESSTGKFTLTGHGGEGLHIYCVATRMSDGSPYRFDTVIGKSGKFEINVTLPKEGYWLMTYVIENNDTLVDEGTFEPITYQKDLITVNLNGDLPGTMVLTGNELVISGTTLPKTQVHCDVDGRYHKSVTTNNSGAFSFTIDTSAEGLYNISLTFQKKEYDTRRFTCEASRTYTEEDKRQQVRDEAVKPGYSTLTSKIDGYKGRYMVYTLHVQTVEKTETGYLAFAGMSKSKSGVYKEMVAIRSTDDPGFVAGEEVRVYLKCIGTYPLQVNGKTENYPYFDLQFID